MAVKHVGATAEDFKVRPTVNGTGVALQGEGGGLVLITAEVTLGSTWRRTGRFTIPGSGLVAGKQVFIGQANGPYTGKGTREDEAEMDQLIVTGKVLDTTTIQCFWSSQYWVRGNFKFNYVVSA